MKGVSAVIATIMMLVITIALAGMAYMYISGSFQSQTGKIVELDPGAAYCSGTTIYVYLKNIGAMDFDLNKVNIFKQGGTPTICNTTGTATAGGSSVKCDTTITGTGGANTIVVTGVSGGPTNTVRGTVYC